MTVVYLPGSAQSRSFARRLRAGRDWQVAATYRRGSADRAVLVGRTLVLAAKVPSRQVEVTSQDVRTKDGAQALADHLRQEAWDLSGRVTDLAGVYTPVRCVFVTPWFTKVQVASPAVGYALCTPGQTREWFDRVPRDLPEHAVSQLASLARSAIAAITAPEAVRETGVQADTF